MYIVVFQVLCRPRVNVNNEFLKLIKNVIKNAFVFSFSLSFPSYTALPILDEKLGLKSLKMRNRSNIIISLNFGHSSENVVQDEACYPLKLMAVSSLMS